MKLRDRLGALKVYRYLSVFWACVFGACLSVIGLASFTAVYLYFTLPTVDMAITLPTNVWFAYIMGGVSRDFLLGVLICLSFYEFRHYNKLYKLEASKNA